MHDHLATLTADAEAVRAEATRLRDTLSDEQLTWRSDPGTWSVADVFEHLRKIDKAYCRALDEAVERASPGADPYVPSVFGRLFIRSVSPGGLRVPAPTGVRPRPTPPGGGAEAVDRFLSQQEQVLGLIERADGKDLNRARVTSPMSRLVRLSLGEALTVVVRHEQRHLAQALRLTGRPDFPSS
jgi:uncharacterized damage-inducible protein DinB